MRKKSTVLSHQNLGVCYRSERCPVTGLTSPLQDTYAMPAKARARGTRSAPTSILAPRFLVAKFTSSPPSTSRCHLGEEEAGDET